MATEQEPSNEEPWAVEYDTKVWMDRWIRARATQHFANANEASQFYAAKDKAKKHPKVVKGELPNVSLSEQTMAEQTSMVPAPNNDVLDQLAATANDCHSAAEGLVTQAVHQAREAGAALRKAKELVPHGQWETWLEENFEGSAERLSENSFRLQVYI